MYLSTSLSTYLQGVTIFQEDRMSDSLFFIEDCLVELLVPREWEPWGSTEDGHLCVPMQRHSKISSGGVFGEESFLICRPCSIRAVAVTPVSLWRLDAGALVRMETRHPSLCILVQQVLLKSMAIRSSTRIQSSLQG